VTAEVREQITQPLPPQQRKIMMAQAPCPEAAEPFRTWLARADRILY